jgi:hypothetical protein
VLAACATTSFAVDAVRGRDDPLTGWWSERLESVSPSWLVATDVMAVGVVEIAALLLPFVSERAPEVELEMDVASGATRIHVRTPDGEETIVLALASSRPDVRRAAAFVETR